MKPYRRLAFGLILTCIAGLGAAELPASAAPLQPAQATARYHHQHSLPSSGPLSLKGLGACAEHLGLPDAQSLAEEVARVGLEDFSLHVLGQILGSEYLLAGELAYPIFDFWLNCVAPYLPVPGAQPVVTPTAPSSGGQPTTLPNPGSGGIPTPPFYTLGGGG